MVMFEINWWLLISIIGSVIVAGIIHELGHYLMALRYGHRLTFKRHGIRFIWEMPYAMPSVQRWIALAGFGAELLSALLIGWLVPIYTVVVVLHLTAYRFYAGEYNDFNWL